MGEDEVGNALEDAATTRERKAAADYAASPRGLAERVLGKGVHPAALERLFELWPLAHVEVRHGETRHDGVDLRTTTVALREFAADPAWKARGHARCRLDVDNFSRRKGIDLAFRRALKKVKQASPEEGRG